MFRFMIQKLRHKKWLALCLLIGNILLVAVAAGYPMYKDASLQRMLTDEFVSYGEKNGVHPGLITMSSISRKGEFKEDFLALEEYSTRVCEELGVDVEEYVANVSLSFANGESQLTRSNKAKRDIKISTLTNLLEHSTLVAGNLYRDTLAEDGCLEAVVTEAALVEQKFVLGEVMEFQSIKDLEGKPLRIRIVGVIADNGVSDSYWVMSPEDYLDNVFVSETMFNKMFRGNRMDSYNINATWYVVGDYRTLRREDAKAAMERVDSLLELDTITKSISCEGYRQVLEEYVGKEKKINATLVILQVPVLALLAAFLFMISGQMLSMEQSEISLLKSRGAGKRQIIRLYFLQNLVLAAIAFVIGLPLGIYLCKMIGSSTAFLEFGVRRDLAVTLTGEVFAYAGVAIGASVLLTLIPVFKYSGVSIVHVKRKKARSQKKIWQKLFLDVIATGVALYGYYNFSGRLDELKKSVMAGEPLDPLLYFSASLFILGVGLLFLRLQPLLIRLLFIIRKRSLSPAGYASFLQTIRTGAKQQFVKLFLILTVALGIFNATVARTIIANAEQNTEYLTGSNLVVQERWKSNEAYVKNHPTTDLYYSEPEFSKYEEIPGVESAARVLRQDIQIVEGKEVLGTGEIFAINTKEYGETVVGDKNLNAYQTREYLNVLSTNAKAVLVSDNFRVNHNKSIGDKITYENAEGNKIEGVIYGFVDYWSGYVPTEQVMSEGEVVTKENYLVIAHLSQVQEGFDVRPYQVWLKTNQENADFFYEWAAENNYKFTSVESLQSNLAEIRTDTLFQGTNGILTLSFIIILLLCGVGYLIYWILSIRERELLFGVFRAMGMRKNEILHMLVNEQIFSGILSIAFGAVVGFVASAMYVPMIQITYAAEKQVLPQTLITDNADMVKLFVVIGAMLLVCIGVLIRNIVAMKITNALKLGED